MVSLVEKNTFLEVEGLEEENEFGTRGRRSIMSEPNEATRRMSCMSVASGGKGLEPKHYNYHYDYPMQTIPSVGPSSVGLSSVGLTECSSFLSFQRSEGSLPSRKPQYLPMEMHGRKVLVNLGNNRWRVTNEFLQAEYSTGIYYQKCKHPDNLDTDTEFVHWETVLDKGLDESDGWVSFDVTLENAWSPLQQLRLDYEQDQQRLGLEPVASDSDSDSASDQESCGGPTAGPTDEPVSVEADPSDHRTTLMVRGLAPGLCQAGFVQHFLDRGYAGLFNFAYMPMNFRNIGSSFGYAFINFTAHEVAERVIRKLESVECPSEPQGWSATWSSSQGWDGNIDRYRNSPLMHPLVPAACKPAVFNQNGSQVPFPAPTKSIPKPRAQKQASTGSMTPFDSPPQEQHHAKAPGLGSVGYPMASASPPTASNGMRFGDATPSEQGLEHRPGRCKRRQPRRKKGVASTPTLAGPMQVLTHTDQRDKVSFASADPAFISIKM